MNQIWSNVVFIAVLILIQGVFVAAEMSLVSLRESQIKKLATRGARGAAVAQLASNPNRFLSAVSIGITLSGFLASAFGGAMLTQALAQQLEHLGIPASFTEALALILVTLAISYFSIVIGELVAKRLAMQRAESFSMALAPLVNVTATVIRPAIWFLGHSTNLVVRMLGGDPTAGREEVTEEELRVMVSSTESLGRHERQILDEVFTAGQVSLREAMVPRTEVDFLPGDMPAYKAIRFAEDHTHSRFPVMGEDIDDILGFIHVRDLFELDPAERQAPIRQLVRPIATLPATVKILRALSEMQESNMHMVVVSDEYGGTAGIVTIEDLVEELIGDITDEFDLLGAQPTATADSLENLDGLTTLSQFHEKFHLVLPEGHYGTLGGFVMTRLGRLPQRGDRIEVDLQVPAGHTGESGRYALTVVDVDGRRASRLTMQRLGPLVGP